MSHPLGLAGASILLQLGVGLGGPILGESPRQQLAGVGTMSTLGRRPAAMRMSHCLLASGAKDPSTETNGQSALKVGGHSVHTFNDIEFSKVRHWYQVDSSTFLQTIDFESMEEGGGKGGMMMAFTADKAFIVKELNSSDHASLLKIAAEYAKHILAPEGSLLARFFAHFSHKGHNYLVMNNWMPPPKLDAVDDKTRELLSTNFSQYDLKGCADDKTLKKRGKSIPAVHKRIFNPHMWCCTLFWTAERQTYYQGKVHARQVYFNVTQKARDHIKEMTERDVAQLRKWQLMDYSLVVAYHVLPRNLSAVLDASYRGTSDRGRQPFIGHKDDMTFIVYIGIIDFLQDWSFKKVVANCIKVAETNKATIPPPAYGDRFARFVRFKFLPNCEDA